MRGKFNMMEALKKDCLDIHWRNNWVKLKCNSTLLQFCGMFGLGAGQLQTACDLLVNLAAVLEGIKRNCF